MSASMFLLLALPAIIAADSSRCWSSGNGQPAKWWNNGEQVERGKYWYVCSNGELQPQGCFSSTGERLRIGEEFQMKGFVNKCVLDNEGYLTFEFTACIAQNGQVVQPEQTWRDPKNIYEYKCSRVGEFLKITVEGCLTHDKSRVLKIGEKYDMQDYTYACQEKSNGVVQLCSVGCVHEGQHYGVGQQWQNGEYIYYCKLNGGRCQKNVIGCVYENKNLYDGDRYRKGETVYQCQIRQDTFGHKPVGCISHEVDGSSVERVIGCRWYLTTTQSKIEQTCELEDSNTNVKTVACIYRHNGFDTVYLHPGTYTIFNLPKDNQSIGLSCKMSGTSAELGVFQLNELPSRTAGLTYDQPRGK
ncbi:unnamed protein product [Auanema sp. JU1783]|nr:unnamed protein product [Auanema sp. JU1783]